MTTKSQNNVKTMKGEWSQFTTWFMEEIISTCVRIWSSHISLWWQRRCRHFFQVRLFIIFEVFRISGYWLHSKSARLSDWFIFSDLNSAHKCYTCLQEKKFQGKTLIATKQFHIDELNWITVMTSLLLRHYYVTSITSLFIIELQYTAI